MADAGETGLERSDRGERGLYIDEAIAVCDGDLRATIRALMVEHIFLERLLAKSPSRRRVGVMCGAGRRGSEGLIFGENS